MLESGDKDSKRAAIIVSHMFKKLSEDEEDMKKKRLQLIFGGLNIQCLRFFFFLNILLTDYTLHKKGMVKFKTQQ